MHFRDMTKHEPNITDALLKRQKKAVPMEEMGGHKSGFSSAWTIVAVDFCPGRYFLLSPLPALEINTIFYSQKGSSSSG